MTRAEQGDILFRAAEMAPLFLENFSRLRMARFHIDIQLRRLQLPAAKRPILKLPHEFRDHRLRQAVKGAINAMSNHRSFEPA
eukprot:3236889-Pyramimonas_sp.AAC.1